MAKRTTDNKLSVAGVVVSVVWIGLAIWYVVANWSEVSKLPPNSLGDFLAGTFAPLAFLWLVLGFYQQGEELRNSVDALTLQSEEMRNSVAQQKILAEAAQNQAKRDKENADRADERSKHAKFHASFDRLGGGRFVLKLKNVGEHDARNLSMSSLRALSSFAYAAGNLSLPKRLIAGQEHSMTVTIPPTTHHPFAFRLEWIDGADAKKEEFTFNLT